MVKLPCHHPDIQTALCQCMCKPLVLKGFYHFLLDFLVFRFERDFEIVGVLGRGGFGEVYDVRKPLDECSYAVKRIRLPRRSGIFTSVH